MSFDEFPDPKNENKPKSDLYFSDVNGIVSRCTISQKFGPRKKLSKRAREKTYSFCFFDHDEKSVFVTEIGNSVMRIFEKASIER